jgi:hypothetical protein
MAKSSLAVRGPGAPSRELGLQNKREVEAEVLQSGLRVVRILKELGIGKIDTNRRWFQSEAIPLGRSFSAGDVMMTVGVQVARFHRIKYGRDGKPHVRWAISDPHIDGVPTAVSVRVGSQETSDENNQREALIANPVTDVENLKRAGSVQTNMGDMPHNFNSATDLVHSCVLAAELIAEIPRPALVITPPSF